MPGRTRTIKAMLEETKGQFAWPDSSWKRSFRRRLLLWYARQARDLPWRRSRDPYRVWVSEIMLQQTQVATVERYYCRFLEAFPTLRALAAAPEEQVLRQWEGLGYYRRARLMHRAAARIVAEHGGRFPRDPELVRRLPGIGRYTAGAITSIAFEARQPILEANTIRLLSRLSVWRGDSRSAAGQKVLWGLAEELLPATAPGTFNQALMELGSRVCTPRRPRCGECPVARLCGAHAAGVASEIPLARVRPRPEEVREAAVVVRRRGRILLVRRGDEGRWAGLWDFPRFRLDRAGCSDAELAGKLGSLTGVTARPQGLLATIKHGVTRFRITLECHMAEYLSSSRRPQGSGPELRWVRPAELERFPLCTSGRRISRMLA